MCISTLWGGCESLATSFNTDNGYKTQTKCAKCQYNTEGVLTDKILFGLI